VRLTARLDDATATPPAAATGGGVAPLSFTVSGNG
jgi:hypothetical protein